MLSDIFLRTDQVLFLSDQLRGKRAKGFCTAFARAAVALKTPYESGQYSASESSEDGELS